jgi:CRISPR-associated protein Csm2
MKKCVEKAEAVITSLQKNRIKGITTNKLRNLLSLTNFLFDMSRQEGDVLSEEMQERVAYTRMRFAYEAGRDQGVKEFIEKAELMTVMKAIGNSKSRLEQFCRYMESLVGFHKFYFESEGR